jgi:hypothetical protein
MVPAPALHALNMEGATEVKLIFFLREPLLLARRLAGLSAFGLFAVLVVAQIAGIGREEVVAVLALALSDPFCH